MCIRERSQQVILKSEPVHPFGLAVYGEHIFWTDWVRRAVQRANKYVGSDMKLLRVDIPQQPMGIIAVANDTNSCEWGLPLALLSSVLPYMCALVSQDSRCTDKYPYMPLTSHKL